MDMAWTTYIVALVNTRSLGRWTYSELFYNIELLFLDVCHGNDILALHLDFESNLVGNI